MRARQSSGPQNIHKVRSEGVHLNLSSYSEMRAHRQLMGQLAWQTYWWTRTLPQTRWKMRNHTWHSDLHTRHGIRVSTLTITYIHTRDYKKTHNKDGFLSKLTSSLLITHWKADEFLYKYTEKLWVHVAGLLALIYRSQWHVICCVSGTDDSDLIARPLPKGPPYSLWLDPRLKPIRSIWNREFTFELCPLIPDHDVPKMYFKIALGIGM